jgi:hypothetical protein
MGAQCLRGLLVLAALVGAILNGHARQDLLNEVKQRREIAIQQLEADLRDFVNDAQKLQRTDPLQAGGPLDSAQRILDSENILPPLKKEAWLRKVRTLRASFAKETQTTPPARQPQNQPETVRSPTEAGVPSSGRNGVDNRPSRETTPTFTRIGNGPSTSPVNNGDKVRQDLSELNRLKDEGKLDERASRAELMARNDPGNAFSQFASRQARIDSNRAAVAKDKESFNRANDANLNDIDKAGVPQVVDVTLPADWAEKTKRRQNSQMSPKERQLMAKLAAPIKVDLQNKPLQDFQEIIEKHLGVAVIIDRAAIEGISVTSETTVNLKANNWSCRSVLRKTLADLGLTYIVRNEEIQITTPDRAREMMITKAYYVGDLLSPLGQGSLPVNHAQMMLTINGIIESIKSQVDADSWAPRGAGTIVFEPLSKSILVKQTAEAHFQLGSGIR